MLKHFKAMGKHSEVAVKVVLPTFRKWVFSIRIEFAPATSF